MSVFIVKRKKLKVFFFLWEWFSHACKVVWKKCKKRRVVLHYLESSSQITGIIKNSRAYVENKKRNTFTSKQKPRVKINLR